MKYTKKQKIAIYEDIIKIFETNPIFGICFHLSRHCREFGENSLSKLFPEIWALKPKDITYFGSYWFSLHREGNQKRIELLKKAIKSLS